jgi:hypothetical protein
MAIRTIAAAGSFFVRRAARVLSFIFGTRQRENRIYHVTIASNPLSAG